eukprot:TRINITY_DN26693_c0_g4_i2.p1 TRINITY_DN26693_c0_g4~~TRINITY_DN26693_c0_g4_i2.p1  ORF type:complete len:511 (-),score=51.38 TRINITY_DN26693_c0_g4_i2:91-1623(-)
MVFPISAVRDKDVSTVAEACFCKYDSDRDRALSFDELSVILSNIGDGNSDAVDIMKEFNKAGDDMLSFDECVDWLVQDHRARGKLETLVETGSVTCPDVFDNDSMTLTITYANGEEVDTLSVAPSLVVRILLLQLASLTGIKPSRLRLAYEDAILPLDTYVGCTGIPNSAVVTLIIQDAAAGSHAMARSMHLEDFEMLRTMRVGAFGKLDYARNLKDEKVYVVKCIRKDKVLDAPQFSQGSNMIQRVTNERLAMAQMDSPFVVNLFGYAKDSRFLYLVIEYVSDCSLASFLELEADGGRFDNDRARFVSAQVAEAVAHCHSVDVIHRGVEPENVFFSSNGYVKLAGFGCSKILEPGRLTFTVCGTPAYRAPERVEYDLGHGKPADWWSLGCLIYCMFVGYSPFEAEDEALEIEKIRRNELTLPPCINVRAKDLIKGLLRPDPSQRYASVARGRLDVFKRSWLSEVDRHRLKEADIPSPFGDYNLFRHVANVSGYMSPPEVQDNDDKFADW